MKRWFFILVLVACFCGMANARADLNGSTYNITGPFSLLVTNGDVTIGNVLSVSTNYSVLIISNSAANSIFVNWIATAHAVGFETTNRLSLPSGKIVQITIDNAFPDSLSYFTQQEYTMPVLPGTTNSAPTNTSSGDIVPELLYYQLNEGGVKFESSPVFLSDSSKLGTVTGKVTSTGVPIQWVTNEDSVPYSAINFNGISTSLDTGDTTDFNFTTNLFTVNMWVRPLAGSPVLAGNGTWQNNGWFITINQYGALVLCANSLGLGTYIGTGGGVIPLGQWSMITIVRTGTATALFYRNGIPQATTGSFADPASCNGSLLLGNYHGGGINYYGDLGATRIYNRAISQAEITTLYSNSVSGIFP